LVAFLLLGEILSGTSVSAKSSTLLIGGGCQESLSNEMKLESEKYLSQMSSLGWSASSVYGKNPEDLSEKTTRPFTKKNFIDELKRNAADLESGDQFLLNFVRNVQEITKT